MWFETINKYYKKNYYNDEQIKKFVKAGYIDELQYKNITGLKYN